MPTPGSLKVVDLDGQGFSFHALWHICAIHLLENGADIMEDKRGYENAVCYNAKGHKTGVIISLDEYRDLISAKKELEDIEDFDEIMADDSGKFLWDTLTNHDSDPRPINHRQVWVKVK